MAAIGSFDATGPLTPPPKGSDRYSRWVPNSPSEPRLRHGLGQSEFIILSALISATIAISIDTILPAFDELSAQFDLDDGSASLSITVFLAAMGVGMLVWGPLADCYGRKPILWMALGLFTAGAVLASLADSFTVFLIGRVVWGLAAAGPRVIGLAIVRDCYSGDQMARIMSLISAVFLIIPVLAPALGEAILAVATWRWTTGLAAIAGAIVAVWLLRLSETLDPAQAKPVRIRTVMRGASTVVGNRTTLTYTLATMFAYAAFFPWLGSSPRIINDIYNRPSLFALLFALNAAAMACAIMAAERLVKYRGAVWVAWWSALATLVSAAGYIAVSVIFDGEPTLVLWFTMATIMTMLSAAFSPITTTLAMEPMGAIAGIASSVTGAIVFVGSALLASVVDRFIVDSVVPFGVGFLVYTSAAVVALWAAATNKTSVR